MYVTKKYECNPQTHCSLQPTSPTILYLFTVRNISTRTGVTKRRNNCDVIIHIRSVNNTRSFNNVNIERPPNTECQQHNVHIHLEELLYYSNLDHFNIIFLNPFCLIYWIQCNFYATYFGLSYTYACMFCVFSKRKTFFLLRTHNFWYLQWRHGVSSVRLELQQATVSYAPHCTAVFTN